MSPISGPNASAIAAPVTLLGEARRKDQLEAFRPLAADIANAIRRFGNVEGVIVLILAAVAWEITSRFLPPFLFPSIGRIGEAIETLLGRPESFAAIGETYYRIIAFLAAGFVLGTMLGTLAGANQRLERTFVPLIQVKQGVPGVCWVIFAIIWFRDMDVRMAFIIVISTLPSFFYQARDGYRGIPRDLWQMVKALRPTRGQMLTKLILPGLVPSILIGLRINLGTATRVTITAELLAGSTGIGYHLRNAQEQFRMDVAIAWTLVLVVFVILTDLGLALIEKRLLRWRQQPEREA